MGKSLVREAANAFTQGDYVAALDLYKQAGNLMGSSNFKVNVSLCEERIRLSWQRKDSFNASLKSLKVACVMDDFTFHSYEQECILLQLTPENVIDELDQFQPDLLFIESAWRGKDELWNRKIGTLSPELKIALRWCRNHYVPTVFWNKEDPVHFETFLTTAQQFDYVFTTDIDSIARYKAALGAERVFLLPFACQPKTHNPIELYDRKDAFCFAGAYYVRYPDRTRDLETYVEEFPKYKPLEIYDRNFGKDDVNYQFPPAYQHYIVGTLPFNQIDKAYKGYRYAINLNSIKQSQTMFARRIYDLLGSNTITVSNFSRGVRLMFGDLVITTDGGSEAVRRLRQLDSDESHGRKLRLAALRKVMQEHTYAHRLAYIAAKVFGRHPHDGMPHFAVLAVAQTQAALASILNHYQRQSYANRSLLILVPSDFTPLQYITARHVRVLAKSSLKDQTLGAVVGQADWVAVMVPEDYYGPNYLNDLALATRYTDAALVGKNAHFVLQNGAITLQDAAAAYKAVATLPARSSAIRLDQLAGVPLSDWLTTWPTHQFHAANGLAIDEFSYCLNGADTAMQVLVSETVDDLTGVNTGVSMAELTACAERVVPAAMDNDAAPVIKGAQFAAYFGNLPSGAITLKTEHNNWRIESKLPEAKHEYLYATVDHPLADFSLTTEFKFYLDVSPGLNVQLVILFLDAKKQKIGHVIKTTNRNQNADIPTGTISLRFGLRFYGDGCAEIKSLVLGHRNLLPAEMIGQADNLILTNHYPSYNDLYRNGFVHTRVKAYQARGVRCDVFRLRPDEAVSFHEFEDVDVTTGSQEVLDKLLASGQYKNVLVHFLSQEMWAVLQRYIDRIRIVVWIHGAEIQSWHRRDFNKENENENQRTAAKLSSEKRLVFWRDLLRTFPSNLHLVFVSRLFAEDVMEDLGFRIPDPNFSIIHNPINTDLFSYVAKSSDLRKKILSIRPYASRTYANDLSVKAIQHLSLKPYFNDFEIRFVGDGVLFEETLAPLRQFQNVKIERRFLRQDEIAELHKEYGIFLCPSRMDTQGVSRDEAMSSGLVPVTNTVAAIPEFVDVACGVLAKSEDAQGLAKGIAYLYENPQQYLELSSNAAKRVRTQSDQGKIITLELDMFTVKDNRPRQNTPSSRSNASEILRRDK